MMVKRFATKIGPIKIEFFKFKKNAKEVKGITCPTIDDNGHVFQEEMEQQILGLSVTKKKRKKVDHLGVIRLHLGFLKIINELDINDQTSLNTYDDGFDAEFSCGHKTRYRMGVATLIHELTHIWDYSFGEHPYSEDIQFRSLTNWTKSKLFWGGWFQKNVRGIRSADPYEYASPAESLAVNMEFFLMDPEFACRRPALHQVLSEKLGIDPYPNMIGEDYPAKFINRSGKKVINPLWIKKKYGLYRTCETINHVYLAEESGPYFVDPKRIYAVNYLHAGAGKAIFSRWGHSMLHFVVCAPFRDEVNEDCLLDKKYHFVMSPRANIENGDINPLDGIFGNYSSRVFLYRFTDILKEYGVKEKRGIESIPFDFPHFFNFDLKNERRLIELAWKQVLESYYTFEGLYYFLTRNCSTEVQDFLNGGILHGLGGSGIKKKIIPKGLRDKLIAMAMLDDTVLRIKNKRCYFYESLRPQMEASFQLLQKLDKSEAFMDFKDWEEFVKEGPAVEARRIVYIEILSKVKLDGSLGLFRVARGIKLMEEEAQRFFLAELQKRFTKKLNDDENLELKRKLESYFLQNQRLRPDRMIRSERKDLYGYGVPLRHEMIRPEIHTQMIIDKGAIFNDLSQLLQERDPGLLKEFGLIEQTIMEAKETENNAIWMQ